MKLPKDTASLLTKTERELVNESFDPPTRGDSWLALKLRIKLMRKFRDKWRDLAQRQKLALRGKLPEDVLVNGGNSRSIQKSEIFAEALHRFEDRLSELHDAGMESEQSGPRKNTAA